MHCCRGTSRHNSLQRRGEDVHNDFHDMKTTIENKKGKNRTWQIMLISSITIGSSMHSMLHILSS